MEFPEITYTLQETNRYGEGTALLPGEFARLIFEDGTRRERMWACVVRQLPNGTYRARLVNHPSLFTELPYGEFVYFRLEHIDGTMTAQEHAQFQKMN